MAPVRRVCHSNPHSLSDIHGAGLCFLGLSHRLTVAARSTNSAGGSPKTDMAALTKATAITKRPHREMRPLAIDSLSGDEGFEKPRKCPTMYALVRQKSRFVFGRLPLGRPQRRMRQVQNVGQLVAAYFKRPTLVLA